MLKLQNNLIKLPDRLFHLSVQELPRLQASLSYRIHQQDPTLTELDLSIRHFVLSGHKNTRNFNLFEIRD